MHNPIHVERDAVAMIASATFPSYTGRSFQILPAESVTLHDLNWGGGSRSQYRTCTLDGAPLGSADAFNAAAPWDNQAEGKSIAIPPGVAVVRHSIFCGKDMGLDVYVNPANMAGLLPAPVELTATEQLVLKYTAERKASYNGKDRYAMAADDAHWDKREQPTRADWDAAKASLIGRGLLNKAGAITIQGRNAYK